MSPLLVPLFRFVATGTVALDHGWPVLVGSGHAAVVGSMRTFQKCLWSGFVGRAEEPGLPPLVVSSEFVPLRPEQGYTQGVRAMPMFRLRYPDWGMVHAALPPGRPLHSTRSRRQKPCVLWRRVAGEPTDCPVVSALEV